jgi:sugar phosphate isomerase/epimerase
MCLSPHSENAVGDPDTNGMVFGDNLAAALTCSLYMRVTLDMGHFTAYNQDVMKFVREHIDRIANLLKDRLHNHPQPHTDEDSTEWDKGDAPLKEVLQFLKRKKMECAATIE